MLWIPAAAAVLAILILLLLPRRYTTTALFMAQTEEVLPASLAGFASELGLTLPGTPSGQSPDFYVSLLSSRPLLEETVTTLFPATASPTGEAASLVTLFDARGDDPAERIDDAVRELRRLTRARAEPTAGLIGLDVTTTHPELSGAIGSRMVELVDRFNVETRRSEASAEREFIEEQIARTRGELTAIEDELEVFIRNNRRFGQSPELSFEHNRLQRHLGMVQSVLTSLTTAYERVKMEEVRATPVITVVQPAHVPARADRRFVLARAVLVGAATFAVCAAFAAARSAVDSARRNQPEDFASLRAAWNDTIAELLRPLRRLRSRSPS